MCMCIYDVCISTKQSLLAIVGFYQYKCRTWVTYRYIYAVCNRGLKKSGSLEYIGIRGRRSSCTFFASSLPAKPQRKGTERKGPMVDIVCMYVPTYFLSTFGLFCTAIQYRRASGAEYNKVEWWLGLEIEMN